MLSHVLFCDCFFWGRMRQKKGLLMRFGLSRFRFWTLLCIAVPWLTRGIDLPSVFLSLITRMAPFNFSNVIIQVGTFNSAQGDLHIHNRYSESGMRFQKHSEKHPYRWRTFIPWDRDSEFLLERFITRPNGTHRQIVALIPTWPFDRWIHSESPEKFLIFVFFLILY